MTKQIKKSILKKKLKSIYKRIINDFQDYDCGHTLLLAMSIRYYELCEEFNQTADKLSKIDPDCPTFRWKLNKH